MDTNERRLMARFTAGEREAYDEVFGLYAGRVMAFARQLTGSRSDAEDLTQEVFVAALAGRNRFRGMSGIFVWLCGIAVRRWRDSRRRPRVPTVEYGESDGCVIPPVGPSLDDWIVFRDALAKLDPLLREPFHLVMVQGLTHREAAVVLQRPIGTVKWCTAMAARRLREALNDDEANGYASVPAREARRVAGAPAGRTAQAQRMDDAQASEEVRAVH